MKSIFIFSFFMILSAYARTQSVTIKDNLDWAYQKIEVSAEASNLAMKYIRAWETCTDEPCRSSAFAMGLATTSKATVEMENAIYFVKEARKLASENCGHSTMLFKDALLYLNRAKSMFENSHDSIANAVENDLKYYKPKDSMNLAKAAIVGDLGAVDNIKFYIDEINKKIQMILECE